MSKSYEKLIKINTQLRIDINNLRKKYNAILEELKKYQINEMLVDLENSGKPMHYLIDGNQFENNNRKRN